MRLPYDVEADFFLLTTCNFRCAYCFLRPEQLGAKIVCHASNEQWRAAFDATQKTWMIHITGGEPFLYPRFTDFCSSLSTNHYLSINSNLGHRSVNEFATRIDPSRVHYINAALHQSERTCGARLGDFISRVQVLRRFHFAVMVSVVMTPAMIATYPALSAHLESYGLSPLPKVMYGYFDGRIYPAAYSHEEQSRLRDYIAVAKERNSELAASMVEAPTIDLFSEHVMLDARRRYRGRLCGSGYNFVSITSNGTVLRCGSGRRLGNILAGDLEFLAAPAPCDAEYCLYFCNKYTSDPFHVGTTGTDRRLKVG